MARIPAFLFLTVLLCTPVFAQDPGAAEDERDARNKLLKAADQIDMLQVSNERIQTDLNYMKSQVAKFEDENAALRQEVADLKAAIEKIDAARGKEREVLLNEVGKIVASKPAPPAPEPKKSDVDLPSVTKTEHGFYHVVEKGETLSLISQAYRDKGIKVTVADICKANSLGLHDVLKVGQKLFIPKE